MKRYFLGLLALTALVFGFTGTVDADEAKAKGKKRNPAVLFGKLDTNNDSKLTKDELSKIGEFGKKKKEIKSKKIDAMLTKLDTNNDGSLTKEEFSKITEIKKKKTN